MGPEQALVQGGSRDLEDLLGLAETEPLQVEEKHGFALLQREKLEGFPQGQGLRGKRRDLLREDLEEFLESLPLQASATPLVDPQVVGNGAQPRPERADLPIRLDLDDGLLPGLLEEVGRGVFAARQEAAEGGKPGRRESVEPVKPLLISPAPTPEGFGLRGEQEPKILLLGHDATLDPSTSCGKHAANLR